MATDATPGEIGRLLTLEDIGQTFNGVFPLAYMYSVYFPITDPQQSPSTSKTATPSTSPSRSTSWA